MGFHNSTEAWLARPALGSKDGPLGGKLIPASQLSHCEQIVRQAHAPA